MTRSLVILFAVVAVLCAAANAAKIPVFMNINSCELTSAFPNDDDGNGAADLLNEIKRIANSEGKGPSSEARLDFDRTTKVNRFGCRVIVNGNVKFPNQRRKQQRSLDIERDFDLFNEAFVERFSSRLSRSADGDHDDDHHRQGVTKSNVTRAKKPIATLTMNGRFRVDGQLLASEPENVAARIKQQSHKPGVFEDIENGTVYTTTPIGTSWFLDRIDAPGDDDIFEVPAQYASHNYSHIYVVDTGARASHQEFRFLGNGSAGRLTHIFDSYPSEPLSCNFHGSHVAALAGGLHVGRNPNSLIFQVRALDCDGWGWLSDIISGLYAIEDHCIATAPSRTGGITVNLSLGGTGGESFELALAEAFIALRDSCDANIVVSAGNAAENACSTLPAALVAPSQGHVITTAASNIQDRFADYSNFGSCVILVAPGSDIYSATGTCDTCYGYASGTSMASPLAANIISRHKGTQPVNWYSAAVALRRDNRARDQAVLYSNAIRFKLLSDAQSGVISSFPPNTPNRLLQIDSNSPMVVNIPPGNDDISSIVLIPDPPFVVISKSNITRVQTSLLLIVVLGIILHF